MQDQIPTICILVTYIQQPKLNGFRSLSEHCIELRQNKNIGFEECHISDVLETAKNLAENGCKILLCTGATANFLQKKLSIDIYTIRAEGFDVIQAISSMRESEKIALLTSHHQMNLNDYRDIFSLHLEQFSYDSYLSAKNIIQQVKASGFQAVVGSPVAVELALIAGLDAKLSIGERSLCAVLEQAQQRLEKLQQDQTQLDSLTQVFNHLQQGIGLVSKQGVVEFCNASFAEITQSKITDIISQPIERLFTHLKLNELQKDQVVQVIQYHNKRLAIQCIGFEQERYLINLQELSQLEKTNRDLRKSHHTFKAQYNFSAINTQDIHFLQTLELAKVYAQSESTILITGESGTGKEMLAQSIHSHSVRKDFPFVVVNCASFPESLLESELFGYEDGAFTGARKSGRIGLIESAHQGTLFLDEIGDMPIHLQSRLLRVLQEKQIQRLGSSGVQNIDIRVIAATHQPLELAIQSGKFRADLYYRLNVLRLHTPPLRQRAGDIEYLCERYLAQFNMSFDDLPQMIKQQFSQYKWPGNIRELENILQRLVILKNHSCAKKSEFIREHIPEIFKVEQKNKIESDLKQLKIVQEKQLIEDILRQCNGNVEKAAQMLKISRTTLWRKVKQNKSQ